MAIVEGSTEGTLHKSTNQVLLKVVQTMTVGYVFGAEGDFSSPSNSET